ncbi:MAG: YciI family protein [Chthoniobacteraceae bacterium]
MNPQQPTNEHLLLIRGTHWNHGMSPGELQRVMTDFYAWVEGLNTRGILRGAQPLMEEGKLVSGTRAVAVTDGVFAESKEAIAGYFLLSVDSMDAALEIAKACPILAHGAQIEVRPVADLCRPMAEVKAAHHV